VSFPRFDRLFAVLAFVILIFPCTADAQTNTGNPSTPQTKGALTCFSVEPIKGDSNLKHEDYPTCDALCAKQDAVCTGTQSSGAITPPITCADHTSSLWAVCRCCKVQE
jgi:hypothetical protein